MKEQRLQENFYFVCCMFEKGTFWDLELLGHCSGYLFLMIKLGR